MDKAKIIDISDIRINKSDILGSEVEDHSEDQIVEFVSVNKFNKDNGLNGNLSPSLSQSHKDTLDSITEMYSEMNAKYGFEVKFDISTLTTNFRDIIDPNNMKVFKVYLSESFERFRLVFIQTSLVAITVLLQRVTNPILLNDPGMDVGTLYAQMNQLFILMDQVNKMYESIKIDDADTILKSMDMNSSDLDKVTADPEILEVMSKLQKLILK